MDAFQELNQTQCITAALPSTNKRSLRRAIGRAIDLCAAVSRKGPAVVEIPVNFGFQEIDENSYYGLCLYERSSIVNEVGNQQSGWEILNNAERPVIYAGYGG